MNARVSLVFVIACLCVLAVAPVRVAPLTPAAVAAFDRYKKLTEDRLSEEAAGRAAFFWLDWQPDKAALEARLKAGEVIIVPMETRDAGRKIEAPDALLHHWLATVFFPRANLDRTLRLIQDYDRYAEFFGPMINRSKLRGRSGDTFTATMQLYTKKVVTVVLNVDSVIDYHQMAPGRVWSASRSVRVAEVEGAGTPGEYEKSADASTGYLWRMNLYCHFQEHPDGTMEQCESVSMTRDIPWGLGWLIGPFINSIPREALTFTLSRARAGLLK